MAVPMPARDGASHRKPPRPRTRRTAPRRRRQAREGRRAEEQARDDAVAQAMAPARDRPSRDRGHVPARPPRGRTATRRRSRGTGTWRRRRGRGTTSCPASRRTTRPCRSRRRPCPSRAASWRRVAPHEHEPAERDVDRAEHGRDDGTVRAQPEHRHERQQHDARAGEGTGAGARPVPGSGRTSWKCAFWYRPRADRPVDLGAPGRKAWACQTKWS